MKSQNEQELIALGKQLGQRLEKQDVVILTGDLGAGKQPLQRPCSRVGHSPDDQKSYLYYRERI